MPKPSPDIRQEYEEGPPAAKTFDALVRRVVSVPRSAVEKSTDAPSRKRKAG